jgi:hypothetical protein
VKSAVAAAAAAAAESMIRHGLGDFSTVVESSHLSCLNE